MEEKEIRPDIDSMIEKAMESLGFRPIVLYKGKNYYPAQLSYSINESDNTIVDAVIKFTNNKPEKDDSDSALDNIFHTLKEIIENIENYKLIRIFDDENNILKEYNLQTENK